jgi:glycosyltransferase involved in cell wall biosynthesis
LATTRRPRVAFVYPNSRAQLLERVASGAAPDSTLLGQNHMAAFGIDARVHEPRLDGWYVRELALPWELDGVDVVCTPLAELLPLAAKVRRRPHVVVINYGLNTMYLRRARFRRRLLRASLRAASSVVCLGEPQRVQLIALAALGADRVHTVHLGIDARWFSPRGASGTSRATPLVLAVGKDLARDYRTFVDAARPLAARVEIAAYDRNVAGLELPQHVRAREYAIAELRDLYAAAACVVIPQRRSDYAYGSEGGGLTALLEAMAMGKPVVASDRPILRDYVRDGENALLVPAEDPPALRATIERVLGDAQLARRLGEAARASVERAFTTEHMAEGLAGVVRAAS